MKARAIVGKTVAKVNQTTFWNSHIGAMDSAIDSITFTDGTVIVPHCSDDGMDLFVDFIVRRK